METVTNYALSDEEQKQREYYDSIAGAYNHYYASEPALSYRYGIYTRFLSGWDLSDSLVLDAMCGGGQTTEFFLKMGATVFAQDISEEQLNYYRIRYPDADIRCESVLKMSYPDNTFDLVFTDSLHHVHANLSIAVEEILRVLKPGGYLLIWEPAANSLLNKLRQIWYRNDPKYFTNDEAAFDIDTLLDKFTGRLEPVRVHYGGNFAYFFVHNAMLFRMPHMLVRFYAPAMIALETSLDRLKISKRIPAWVIALLKKK
jgi:SAM-dependent methyltransferase